MSPNTSTARSLPSALAGVDWILEPFSSIPYIPDEQLIKIKKLCGERWIDLLLHLPINIIDRSNICTISQAQIGQIATLKVQVIEHSPGFRRKPYRIQLADNTGELEAVFFQHGRWLQRAFPTEKMVVVSGELTGTPAHKKLVHPKVWSEKMPLTTAAKFWPVYRRTQGLKDGMLHRAIAHALNLLKNSPPPEWLPAAATAQWPSFYAALTQLHNPTSATDILPTTPARERLAFDEFYAHQLVLTFARHHGRKNRGTPMPPAKILRTRLLAALPFKLTPDQQHALADIDTDLSATTPALRLLLGDVGSGKTIVALLALLRVIEAGYQGVFLAPTTILAEQHFHTAQKLLAPLGIKVALLSSTRSSSEKKRDGIYTRDGFAQLIIGTHAVLADKLAFHNLGLIVIDEQHRFGVEQRLKLSSGEGKLPHVLLMSATPIPRSLALALYGDMELSTLKHKPPGRLEIATRVIPLARENEIVQLIQRRFAENARIYWVCPLIDETADQDTATTEKRFEILTTAFPDKVGLVHGKLRAAQKQAAMDDFAGGRTPILVSTSVIEVGVDVPEATTIVIEQAERFGLSQLHQLRGRVGRGKKQSECLLLYSQPLTPTAQDRLAAMREYADGLTLAEKDLELRGPGEILGTRQTGTFSLKVADLAAHKALIPLARTAAENTLAAPVSSALRTNLNLLVRIFDKQETYKFLAAG